MNTKIKHRYGSFTAVVALSLMCMAQSAQADQAICTGAVTQITQSTSAHARRAEENLPSVQMPNGTPRCPYLVAFNHDRTVPSDADQPTVIAGVLTYLCGPNSSVHPDATHVYEGTCTLAGTSYPWRAKHRLEQ